MSPFDLTQQNGNLNYKIAVGLERLSQVLRSLLWDAAYAQRLSPAQLQVLVFVANHGSARCSAGGLAAEFGVSRPTMSDTLNALQDRGLITRSKHPQDARKQIVGLTSSGTAAAQAGSGYLDGISAWISKQPAAANQQLWYFIVSAISEANAQGIPGALRNCRSCAYYEAGTGGHFCKLINRPLQTTDLRIDCPEHLPQENLNVG